MAGKEVPLKRFRVVKIAIICLAIILVIGGPAGFFYYEQQSFDNSYNAVRTQLQLCLDNAAKNAVLQSGIRGGRATLSEISYDQPAFNAEYLYFSGVSRTPSTEQWTQAIGELTKMQLDICTAELNSERISVESAGSQIAVSLGEVTSIQVLYPFTVENRLFGRDVSDLKTSVPISVTPILEPVRDIVDHISANKGITDLSVLRIDDYTVTYSIYPADSTVVFLARSKEAKIDGIPLSMMGAVDIA